jgi:hypothetical protein
MIINEGKSSGMSVDISYAKIENSFKHNIPPQECHSETAGFIPRIRQFYFKACRNKYS